MSQRCGSSLFAGIDLAWSERNPSGVVILSFEGGILKPLFWLWDKDLGSFFELIGNWSKGILVAIDAPLIVPNRKSRRPVDATISERFRKEEAGCLPANRTLLKGLNGLTWPEKVVQTLQSLRVRQDPRIRKGDRGRKVFEVFPHPAHVILFSLRRTLKYKARRGRSPDFRQRELKRYLDLLLDLQRKKPPMVLPKGLLDDISSGSLKRKEDMLDALFCAYLAGWFCYYGSEGYEMLGDLDTGYILLPRKPVP